MDFHESEEMWVRRWLLLSAIEMQKWVYGTIFLWLVSTGDIPGVLVVNEVPEPTLGFQLWPTDIYHQATYRNTERAVGSIQEAAIFVY